MVLNILMHFIPSNFSVFHNVPRLGAIAARYIAYFSGLFISIQKTLVVTMFSVILNYLFIYKWVCLVAVSTLLVELFSLTILNYFCTWRCI